MALSTQVQPSLPFPRPKRSQGAPHSLHLDTEERPGPLSTPCRIWRWKTNRDGYGYLCVPGARAVLAHRFYYAQFFGPISDGLFVLHKCDVPACVSPAHLYLGDQTQNMRDRDSRGRQQRHERHWCAKVNAQQVAEIRAEAARGVLHRVIAERVGLSRPQVSNICRGATWAPNAQKRGRKEAAMA